MPEEIIKVPDIGGDSATVIEVCVKLGDSIKKDESIIVLESDKASMEVPAPKDGIIKEILVKLEDSVSEGVPMVKLDLAATEGKPEAKQAKQQPSASTQTNTQSIQKVLTPDLGVDSATIIEVCAQVGDEIQQDDSLITIESDKASMDVPSPYAGIVKSMHVKQGDAISTDMLIAEISTTASAPATETKQNVTAATSDTSKTAAVSQTNKQPTVATTTANEGKYHAGPAVRKLARELDISLSVLQGTGPNHRIVKEDLHGYIKNRMNQGGGGAGIPQIPQVDFSKWGEVTTETQSRAQQIASTNFQTAWLNIPHVTQFDQADITDLENFRKGMKKQAEAKGVKLTPLAFIIKACAHAIVAMPEFASSLADGNKQVFKKYINIGVAVDTPFGLFVPVIKNANNLGIFEIAKQCVELATKAKEKKLKPNDMQGGCFTISSLGAIGGTAFTPIVNAPEVAILGLSKSSMQPVWNGNEFIPRLMLPLSLSYDHRVINGVQAAKFTATLSNYLADMRNILL
jgi:pyruvate dehydrogenase E2 component (dihydrolipoamide acetyltransferase)